MRLAALDAGTLVLLADLVVGLHLIVVLLAIGGLLAVLIGAPLGWGFIRRPLLRYGHLALVVIVALQALADVLCPLTVLENWLRRRAGRPLEEATFLGRLIHEILFVDLDPDSLTAIYVGFAAACLVALWLVPPRKAARD